MAPSPEAVQQPSGPHAQPHAENPHAPVVTASMDELEQKLAQQGEDEYNKERMLRRQEVSIRD